MQVESRQMPLDENSLLQANVTVIAGLLIFATISSLAPLPANVTITQSYTSKGAMLGITAGMIAPFIGSIVYLLDEKRATLKIAKLLFRGGLIVLFVLLIVYALLLTIASSSTGK